jgi:hypothetical protein
MSKKLFHTISCFLLCYIALPVMADEVEFTASAPKVVETGEQFALKYNLNAKPSKFFAPSFDPFTVLAGPSTSSSSQVQIINGKMTQRYNYTYTYYLRATKAGKFTIPPAKAKVNRDNYTSNALQIEVVGGTTSRPGASADQRQATSSQKVKTDDKNLFVRLLVNKRNVHQGEAIIATIKIYSKLNLSGLENPKIPDFQGFVKEDLETPQLRSLERENVNGEIYGTGILQRFILFPQRPGEITIEPFQIEAIYQKQVQGRGRSIFDDFFGSYQNVRKPLKSLPVVIKVEPLPGNRPAGFTGAVGDFNIQATVDKDKVKANDAITMKVTVSGNGNLKLIDIPEPDFPPDFEVYDPEVKVNTRNNLNGVSGSKTLEYLIIPRHAGNFRIPPIRFAYFSARDNSYKNLSTKEFTITVDKGEEQESTGAVVSGLSKEEIKFIGKDIRYIKTDDVKFQQSGTFHVNSIKYYLILLAGLLAFAGILLLRKQSIKRNADIRRVKNRKANKKARKSLKTAASYLKKGEKEPFYDEMLHAMWGYLGDKLSLPVAGLSKESAMKTLVNRGVEKANVQAYLDLIDTCEMAKYAPAESDIQMNELYQQGVKLLSTLENQIK